jgi:ABC-type Fe3+ transport system permease subunit
MTTIAPGAASERPAGWPNTATSARAPWQVFRTIILPLLRPTLLVVLLLRTIDAARIFDKILS